MTDRDVRWIQRLAHFRRALERLQDAKRLADTRSLSPLEQQGMIKAFEFTFELGWNLLKDFLEAQGAQNLYGSRSAIRAAFQVGLIDNGEVWMAMLDDRNLSSHAYDEVVAMKIVEAIESDYLPQLEALHRRMQEIRLREES